MRLLLAAAAVTLAGPSTLLAEPVQPKGMRVLGPPQASAECPPISRFHASRRADKLAPQKLNQLPTADAYAAVLRQKDGCQVPVIVKYDVTGR